MSEEDFQYEDEIGTETAIIPIAFFPAPKIIDLPKSCPKPIAKVLNESFGLYWSDMGFCANKIRISIEALLDEFTVIKSRQSANGKTHYLSLNERIVEFQRTNQKVGDLLHSVKLIGNAGSHYDDVTRENVLDAYEIMDYLLDQLFPDREESVMQISRVINSANPRL